MVRIFAALLVVLIVIAGVLFARLDQTPYRQTSFYKNEMATIDTISGVQAGADTFYAGWSRVNLQPPFTTPIAIDAHRGGKHYQGIHDSIYVRAFVFKCGEQKVAYVSADLLIIPPAVSCMLDTALKPLGYSNATIYYTATHTHSSLGAWQNSWVGEKFAGKFDERVPKHLAACFTEAIRQAEANCQPAEVGFKEIPTTKLVFNRLVGDSGTVDSLLRVIRIKQQGGAQAAIVTFAAHATVYHEKMMELSGDWPAEMMQHINKDGRIGFVSFSAGAVGSQGPFPYSKDQAEEVNYMAGNVAQLVLDGFDSIPTVPITTLRMVHLPLYLRQPNLRIIGNWVVRPWLFHRLFGDAPVFVNYLQLGDLTFVGMPCDFSGELVDEISSTATLTNAHLVPTSFNGGYIGYITCDSWYELNTYETRTMGWFGPGNGAYLSEIAERLLKRFHPQAEQSAAH